MTVPAGTGALEATQQQILQQLQGSGGGESVSIADGANVAQGTTTDVAWTSGAGTEIALLKKLVAQLAATLGVSGTITANAGTGNFTVAQTTGTNLHSVVDSGSITANAGTNLNTSLLALETGGNLASIKTDADSISTNTSTTATNTGRIPAQGAAATSASTPVNIASDQVVPVKRSCIAAYTLASTATSGTTQNSGDLTVGPYTELSIDITTTAQSGTSPTVQYFYERKGADGIYYVLWQSAILTAAANTISTSIGVGMAYNQSLGLTGRLKWVVGGSNTPTYTFSASIYGK